MYTNRPPIRKAAVALLYLAGIALAAGCSSRAVNTASPKQIAESQAQKIQQVQNDPNIPPQVKAGIIQSIQGKGVGSDYPGATKH